MALKKAGKGYRVLGLGRNAARLKAAKKLGAIDEYFTDWTQGVQDADVVVICTPVNLTAPAVGIILPFLKPGAVITDAGSVKGCVHKEVAETMRLCKSSVVSRKSFGSQLTTHNLQLPVFVGSHPMAGSEKTGVNAARKDLYRGATVVITAEKAKPKAVAVVEKLWRDAGGKIVRMSAAEHDKLVAVTSHLPHAVAFSLCSLADKKAAKVIAGSFKDMTRIAGSNPADWAVISSCNKEELGNAIDGLINKLKVIKSGLSSPKKIEKLFAAGKLARQKLLNNTK